MIIWRRERPLTARKDGQRLRGMPTRRKTALALTWSGYMYGVRQTRKDGLAAGKDRHYHDSQGKDLHDNLAAGKTADSPERRAFMRGSGEGLF